MSYQAETVREAPPRELPQEVIDEIVRRVLTVTKPSRIILFGSAATGDMTRDSDIDLLVVEPEPGDRRGESVRVRDAIEDV
ncbi:MAG: nucleotidyltransferase domain-containing protein, partial [Planctomycetota bacterium]